MLLWKRALYPLLLLALAVLLVFAPAVGAGQPTDVQEASATLESFRQAWEAGDLQAYLSFYDQDAVQEKRRGKKAIYRHKKNLWKKAAPLQVEFSAARFFLVPQGLRAFFEQTYQAKNGYSDRGYKSVILARKSPDGVWLIIEESWQTNPFAPPDSELSATANDASSAISDKEALPYPESQLNDQVAQSVNPDNNTALPEETAPDDFSERQMTIIEARINGRMGHYEKALRLFNDLIRRYPDDMEIREDYLETLIDGRDYEKALSELAWIRKKQPLSPRAARLAARIYLEANQLEHSLALLEDVLESYRRNAGVMADAAYIRAGIGDTLGAMHYYSGALETDPENPYIRDALHSLLRPTRPRVDAGYRAEFKAADTVVQKTGVSYAMLTGAATDIALQLNRTAISRPAGAFTYELNKELTEAYLQLGFRIKDRWRAYLNAGGYAGLGGGFSPSAGIIYNIYRSLNFHLDYEHHRPWFDPVEAAALGGGYQNRAQAALEWIYRERWIFSAALENAQYFTANWGAGDGYYGRKTSGSVGVARRLTVKPELTVGYNYYRSRFTPADTVNYYQAMGIMPISMLEEESLHGFFAGVSINFNAYLSANLNGGYRMDTARSVNSWWANPAMRIRLRNRLEAECGYEYTSEDQSAQGGKSSALNMKVRWIW